MAVSALVNLIFKPGNEANIVRKFSANEQYVVMKIINRSCNAEICTGKPEWCNLFVCCFQFQGIRNDRAVNPSYNEAVYVKYIKRKQSIIRPMH